MKKNSSVLKTVLMFSLLIFWMKIIEKFTRLENVVLKFHSSLPKIFLSNSSVAQQSATHIHSAFDSILFNLSPFFPYVTARFHADLKVPPLLEDLQYSPSGHKYPQL